VRGRSVGPRRFKASRFADGNHEEIQFIGAILVRGALASIEIPSGPLLSSDLQLGIRSRVALLPRLFPLALVWSFYLALTEPAPIVAVIVSVLFEQQEGD